LSAKYVTFLLLLYDRTNNLNNYLNKSNLWKNKSLKEHEEHTKQVAYRAILQKFCSDSKILSVYYLLH